MSKYEEDSRIHACFHGEIPRDCEDCAGRYRCCFGKEYEELSDDCENCIHAIVCRRETINNSAMPYSQPRRSYSSNVTVRRPTASPSSVAAARVMSPSTMSVDPAGRIPINGNWREEAKQVGRDTLWNMVVGALKTVLHFFETHRWTS